MSVGLINRQPEIYFVINFSNHIRFNLRIFYKKVDGTECVEIETQSWTNRSIYILAYCWAKIGAPFTKKTLQRKTKQIHNPGEEEKVNEDKRNTEVICFST